MNFHKNLLLPHRELDTIYTDFHKAFDMVSHSILNMKLKKFNLPPYITTWVMDYLKDRYVSVTINNYLSDPFYIPCGVPQGSHLGPILFLIFINDLVIVINFANILLFADDCKLSIPINSLEDCYKLQSDLDKISLWCIENEMILSINKCNVISFTRCSHPIILHIIFEIMYSQE